MVLTHPTPTTPGNPERPARGRDSRGWPFYGLITAIVVIIILAAALVLPKLFNGGSTVPENITNSTSGSCANTDGAIGIVDKPSQAISGFVGPSSIVVAPNESGGQVWWLNSNTVIYGQSTLCHNIPVSFTPFVASQENDSGAQVAGEWRATLPEQINAEKVFTAFPADLPLRIGNLRMYASTQWPSWLPTTVPPTSAHVVMVSAPGGSLDPYLAPSTFTETLQVGLGQKSYFASDPANVYLDVEADPTGETARVNLAMNVTETEESDGTTTPVLALVDGQMGTELCVPLSAKDGLQQDSYSKRAGTDNAYEAAYQQYHVSYRKAC